MDEGAEGPASLGIPTVVITAMAERADQVGLHHAAARAVADVRGRADSHGGEDLSVSEGLDAVIVGAADEV